MPPAIAAFAAWAGMSLTAAYLTVAAVVISVGTAVYGAAQARKAERAARNSLNEAMKDRMVTRIATEAPHRYIYGKAKVGSDVVAMFTSGDRDQFKHLVCVHAAHECDAIEEIWVNNDLVDSIDSAGDPTAGRFAVDPNSEIVEELVTGPSFTLKYTPRINSVWVFKGIGSNMLQVEVVSVNGRDVTVAQSGQLLVSYERLVRRKMGDLVDETANPSAKNPVVRVQKHLGGADDAADAYLRSLVGDKWPETAVLRGMCYSVITLDLNHPEFQGGLVPIHAVIRGRKLYDPRTGVKSWSMNPALAIMDYLTSPLCGVPMDDLPLAQFITAANVCDEPGNAPAGRYTLNGDVTSDQNQSTVLEAMAQSMAGGLVATTWDVYAGKYVAPVAALTQEDIVGGLSVNPGVSDASVYNGVKGQYISPENNHVQTDFTPYQNPTYREADGRDLYTNLDFPFTDSLQRVTNLARIFTEDQRNGFTIKAEFSLKAWPLKVGQRLTFTSAFLGQNAKVYRITDKSYSPSSAVNLTLKEDAESIWDYADAVVVDSTPNSDLPDPWRLDQLASISCTSGESTLLRQADGSIVPRILASWPAAAQANGLQIDVEWRAVSSPAWARTSVSAGETKAYLSPITPGFFYVVRARVSNPSLNVQSNWVSTVYQVEVLKATPTVYKWAASKPAVPAGAASYLWSNGTFGAAPAGWSLTVPATPAEGNVSLWAASVAVSDIDASGSAPFEWAAAAIASIGYTPAAAGTGPAGYSNARVLAYQRSASAPVGTPGAVTYDFTTATITTATLANGWQKTIPAANGNPLYVTSASASASGTTDSIASNEWSGAVVLAADGSTGAAGLNSATVQIYQRSASDTAPAKPSASTTYTFATGALTGLNNGWATYIPSTGGAYLHTTLATAVSSAATDTIAASEWAAVQLMYDAADLLAAKAAADAAGLKGAAINDDPTIENPAAWVTGTGIVRYTTGSTVAGSVGKNFFHAPGAIRDKKAYTAKAFPIDANRVYDLSAVLYAGPGNDRDMLIFIDFYGSNGAHLGNAGWGSNSSHSGFAFRGLTPTGIWTRQGAKIGANTSKLIPAAARTAVIGVWFQYSTTGTSSVEHDAQDIRLDDITAVEAARAYAEAQAELAEINAKAHADGVVTAEEARAIADATAKAEAARVAAVNAAATDATNKANAAKAAAQEYALAQAELARVTAQAHADDIVTAEEARAIADATAKAEAARVAAVNAAAADATAKAGALATTSLAGRNVTISGNTAVKPSNGGLAWNSDVYSLDSYTGGAYASARINASGYGMFGLNSDPLTDSNWTSMDYAILLDNAANFYVYVGGSQVGSSYGAFSATDVFAVAYDGSSVKFVRNGTVFYSMSAVAGLKLFFDSSLYKPSTTLTNIQFGPMTSNAWSAIGGTGKPADNATVGAPAGTNVAGVPAEQVAAGANAINAAFSATLSGTASGGSYPNGSYGYGYLQVNIAGGNAPYSVRWILTPGDSTGNAGGMTMSSRTGTYNEFNGSGSNCSMDYDVTVIVTDAKQRSLSLGQGISVTHGTPI